MWKGHCVGRPAALIIVAIGWIVVMALSSRAQAETTYTPAVSLSQRYDSNVFYSAKQFLPPGTQLWDLVSTLATEVQALNKSRAGDTEVKAGVNGNAYAYNTDLAYVSTDVSARSDLSPWMHELLPGLHLRLSDAFRYTPEPPAFLTGGTPGQSDVFARGVQTTRANTYSNIFSAAGEYPFSRSVELRTNYTYSIRRTGRSFVNLESSVGQRCSKSVLRYHGAQCHNGPSVQA